MFHVYMKEYDKSWLILDLVINDKFYQSMFRYLLKAMKCIIFYPVENL